MTAFISYAQNFEDVMLWRALKHVERGLYIDLGAQDPVVDSVSLAFHERGWKGIHVEPTSHYAQLLRDQRRGDTVIEAAISNVGDMITFLRYRILVFPRQTRRSPNNIANAAMSPAKSPFRASACHRSSRLAVIRTFTG